MSRYLVRRLLAAGADAARREHRRVCARAAAAGRRGDAAAAGRQELRRPTRRRCAHSSGSTSRSTCSTSTGWARSLHGDLGHSFSSRNPVAEELGGRIPVTLELGILALMIAGDRHPDRGDLGRRARTPGRTTPSRSARDRAAGHPRLLARHAGGHPAVGLVALDAAAALHAPVSTIRSRTCCIIIVPALILGLGLSRRIDAPDPHPDARSAAPGLHSHGRRQRPGRARDRRCATR